MGGCADPVGPGRRGGSGPPMGSVIRDPVDQRDGDHGTWRRPIRLAEPISRIRYQVSRQLVPVAQFSSRLPRVGGLNVAASARAPATGLRLHGLLART